MTLSVIRSQFVFDFEPAWLQDDQSGHSVGGKRYGAGRPASGGDLRGRRLAGGYVEGGADDVW